METILIAGVESVVGANLAAALSERHQIVGLSLTGATDVSIAGCQTALCPNSEPAAVRQWAASARPRHIVYCGPESQSSWWQPDRPHPPQATLAAETWAAAARDFGCRFTFVSSDAVFTGPWMFHTETSESFCPSPTAEAVRETERTVAAACPTALIVRTNAYGWAPAATGPGWIETLLSDLEAGTAGPFDPVRHATPILATDLAEILDRAWQEDLEGFYHVAGAERVSPCRFVERLADQFGLEAPRRQRVETLVERPAGFGRGEMSLHTKKVRKALCVAMPTLLEGLERLYAQTHNGHRERFEPRRPVHGRVA